MNRILGCSIIVLIMAPNGWTQAVIAPPPSVVHEGIPAVPASLGKETAVYRSSPGSSLLGWHPEARQVIVSGYCRNARCGSRVDAPGKAPQFLFNLPDWYREVAVSPRGNFLVYSKPVDENFQDQIYRYDIETKETTLLTDGKSRNRYPAFSGSGKLLAYSSNRRNGRDMDIYVVDLNDPTETRLLAELEGEDWALFDWSPDEQKVILSDYKSYNETYLWLLDLETGHKTLLTPPGVSDKIYNGSYAFFGDAGKGIFFITDRDSEYRRLAYLELSSKRLDFLTEHIKWDIEELAISGDRKTLAFISNQDGIGRLHLMDAVTRKEISTPEIPSGVVSGLIWHRRLPYLGFVLSTTRFPSEVFSVDIEGLKLERWTRTLSPIPMDEFRDPGLIKWTSFDGKSISGFLYRPPRGFTGRRPVIIDIHGGPADQFRPSFRGEDNYFINRLGVACIYPNVRGSTGYGKNFIKLDDGSLREDAVKDIAALLDWIVAQPDLDSSRILIKGNSSGGYLALRVAQTFPTRISAVYAYIAPTNNATFIERNIGNDPDAWRRELGDERDETIRRFFEQTAPVHNAEKIEKPTLLILGGRDLMTSVPETERIVSALQAKGIPVWYVLARNEGHTLVNIWTYNYAFNVQALFVKKYLIAGSEQ